MNRLRAFANYFGVGLIVFGGAAVAVGIIGIVSGKFDLEPLVFLGGCVALVIGIVILIRTGLLPKPEMDD